SGTTEAGSSTSTSTGSSTTSVDPTSGSAGTSTGPTTGTSTTEPAGTTSTSTGDPSTGEVSTTDPSTGDDSTGSTSSTGSSSTGEPAVNKQETWGHGCTDDAECMALVGNKGVCEFDVLGLYELPGGYCTKGCTLPDLQTVYVPDHPSCGPGVHCVGVKGFLEVCLLECSDDSECPREGYECRVLPQIGQPGDPKFCLMTDEYMK
ncbi:MAG TPA: hypothetical protein VIK91_01065, partial [Nannocystis sp.]